MHDTFDLLILIGRPASGKSEIIDYLSHLPADARRRRFHIADLDVLDDFPMLWTWFEEDHILSDRLGQPRLHTDADGYFKSPYLWHLLIERLGLEYQKRLRDDPAYHDNATTIVEFSRGSEHGGYAQAFPHLADDFLRRAAIVYVSVPFEESLRKNRRRFNPERPDSILEHALPDDRLQRLYRVHLSLQHCQCRLGRVAPKRPARLDAFAQLRGRRLRRKNAERRTGVCGQCAKGIAVGAFQEGGVHNDRPAGAQQ